MAKAKKSKAKSESAPKPEKHVIPRCDVTLPRNISFRVQDHGDDKVVAGDVRVVFPLTEEQACTMAKEKYFTRALFKTVGRGKPDQPLIPKLTIKLETIEAARVSLYLGPNGGGEMKLGLSKLKSPEIIFDTGRKLTCSTLVQATPAMGPRIGDLLSRMDGGAQIAIEYEHNAEQLEADLEGDKKPSADDKNEAAAREQVDAFNRGTPIEESPSAGTH